jgi:hypothetical protein
VQEVLHADWQDARQLPQPPDFTDSRRLFPLIVLILVVFSVAFILISLDLCNTKSIA